VLYCAKGIAALLVPFGNMIQQATGTWATVLYGVAVMDIMAALTAVLVLKPLLKKHYANTALKVAALQAAHPVQGISAAGVAMTGGVALVGTANMGGNTASANAAAYAHAGTPTDLSARLAAAEEENRRLRQIAAETKAILNKV
jgi:hypothetical protein